ncbi:MAG: 3-phenylpropionate/cinnamic acid dioxygenase subunit beta [Gammaproteobacteria bacterium]|jgi:ethylbenzene dioxygenase subunit beta|nr:3-phenylpropionate/cinnamic acid dioxygenase subunit beta [Gammaproteobacteria bacterium]
MNEASVSKEIYLSLQQLLFREARLLSAERYDDWLDLLSDDVQYEMEMPQRRFREDRTQASAPKKTPIFNDDKRSLLMRIGRIKTGFVWAENPVNAIRHIVSNIEVFDSDKADEFTAYSIIEIHRSRLDAERKRFTAGRNDIWKKTASGFQLLKRTVALDDGVVLDSNINFFF